MNNKDSNDEINLIDLIVILIKKKLLLLIYAITGLIIGVAHTLTQEPRYQTAFTVEMEHPLMSKNFVITSEVKELIASSEMFGVEGVSPHLSYSESTRKFTITTNNRNIKKIVENLFINSIQARMESLIRTAAVIKSDQIDFQGEVGDKFSLDMLMLLIEDGKLSEVSNEALENLKFNYGPTITHHPKVRKYGVVGLILGLFAGILMVILSMLIDSIKSRQNTP